MGSNILGQVCELSKNPIRFMVNSVKNTPLPFHTAMLKVGYFPLETYFGSVFSKMYIATARYQVVLSNGSNSRPWPHEAARWTVTPWNTPLKKCYTFFYLYSLNRSCRGVMVRTWSSTTRLGFNFNPGQLYIKQYDIKLRLGFIDLKYNFK